MGSPVATPNDLQTYLGLDQIDNARATLILNLAQSLCEAVVSPMPPGSAAVVLEVAKRAFVNPSDVHEVGIGTARVQYAVQGQSALGGLFLSKGNKADLRRLAGGGGGFSINTLPTGTNAVQTVTVLGASGGTFTLSLNGVSTAAISWNATPAAVQTALTTLTFIGAGNVSVAGDTGSPFVVTFIGAMGTCPIPTMSASATGLTGTGPSVTVVTTTPGVLAPGQGLPSWDFDRYSRRGYSPVSGY